MSVLDDLRATVAPSWRNAEDEDPMAMVLVVNNDHDVTPSEQDVLDAACLAVTLALLDERPHVREAVTAWLRGRIRKIVKRARNKAWDDLATLPEYVDEASNGRARVRVFLPQRISQLPPALRKLQVSGLNFERATAVTPTGAHLEIIINAELGMTTGKTVAQVGHAVQLFLMRAESAEVDDWLALDQPLTFHYTTDIEHEHLPIEVHDAGFTEVASNAYTCGARYVRP